MRSTTLLTLALAATISAQLENDDYTSLKPTGTEVTITYNGQLYTIPVFDPSTAPKFGDPPKQSAIPSSLAPPATATDKFKPITGPIPTPGPSSTTTSSLAPPASVSTSFSAITSSIPSFSGSSSTTTSASSSSESESASSSSSSAAESSAAATSAPANEGARVGVGMGVLFGGLVGVLGLFV